MANKQFCKESAGTGDIYDDAPDRIFRLNCINYFGMKRNIGTSNTAGIREFHPNSSRKTSESLRVIVGDNLKVQVSPSISVLEGKKFFNSLSVNINVIFYAEQFLFIKNAYLNDFVLFKVVTSKISHEEKGDSLMTKVPSPELPIVQASEGSQTEMILAVDATPTRVGGLLRLPENERTIFYYSICWTTHFAFDDSTRFEMVNSALALELFKPYLKAYRERYDKLIVKTDSHFYGSIKGFKDPLDVNFLMGIRDKVKCLRGEFQHVLVSQKDADIQNADYLSRTELPIGLKIEYVESNSEKEKAVSYVLVDLSAVARGHTLDVIKEYVPRKYIK